MTFQEIMHKGGPAMWPLLLLSILALGTIIERSWFWLQILVKQKEILNRIIDTAATNWSMLQQRARYYKGTHPVAKFLYAPLLLSNPDPEVFHLALEAAAEDELSMMRRGDKLLESAIALAPLLGLLGTVLGLINSLGSISISDLGTASTAGVTLGIGEALISTATGLIIAIASLAFYRLFQAFWFNQVRIFRKAGNELEMIYRQQWWNEEGLDVQDFGSSDELTKNKFNI